MIYVNGDGFAAASYANSTYSWASQDPDLFLNGQTVHPKNMDASFAKMLSNALHQPLRLEAWERNSQHKILRETRDFIEKNQVDWMVITWPGFFRDEMEHEGVSYQFDFNKIDLYDLDPSIKAAMRTKMQSFNLSAAQDRFRTELEDLCSILEARKIRYAMMMSDATLSIDTGHWAMDPSKTSITKWAAESQNLNGSGFLSEAGQKELAKSLIIYLTSQL